MIYRLLAISQLVILFFFAISLKAIAQEKREEEINWVEGYVTAGGEGTATPSGNKAKDQLRAVRAATILAQRTLLEIVKDLRIDSATKVKNRMVQEDTISTSIEGTIQGAQIVKQHVRWEGETPVATVQMRICLGGVGNCKSEESIVNALGLHQRSEQINAPIKRLDDIVLRQDIVQKTQDAIYDKSKPVTGIIFNLQGLFFERVILPVVITFGDGNDPFTVYSVKSVDPSIIRTYGVVRYADSVEQARQNPHLGANPMIIPASQITRENMIVIEFYAGRLIRETTSHGNDYLKSAKVVIAAR